VLFECAGSASAVELALNATTVGGRIVLVGLDTKPARFVSLPFVRRGLSLLSSLIYDHPTDFQRAVELVQSGRVQPSRLVNHVYGLEDAATAMRAAATGDTGKTLVDVAGIAAERSSSPLREGSGMGAS
jgi:threonine dehydrogenase-like Zn-dependent dehydrogenase